MKSFIRGISRILGRYTTYDQYKKRILRRTDKEAIERDWQAVGDDVRIAIDKYEKEMTEE